MIFNKIHISGVGRHLPSTIITNKDIEGQCGTNDKWVFDNLGIKERRIGDSVVNMGLSSIEEAMRSAGIKPSDLGAVIVSTSSSDKLSPSVATQIIGRLCIDRPAFDINAVCSGFVYALQVACCMISCGYNHVAIVATERYSSITDWGHRDCVYFGDGAGAVIVSKGNGTINVSINANGESGNAFSVAVGGKINMIGSKVRDNAVAILPKAIQEMLTETGLCISDIDYIVPHQPSINILLSLSEKLNIPFHKVVTVMDKYANIASASIPIALCEVYPIGGRKILLATVGAGWTWGVAIIEQ